MPTAKREDASCVTTGHQIAAPHSKLLAATSGSSLGGNPLQPSSVTVQGQRAVGGMGYSQAVKRRGNADGHRVQVMWAPF